MKRLVERVREQPGADKCEDPESVGCVGKLEHGVAGAVCLPRILLQCGSHEKDAQHDDDQAAGADPETADRLGGAGPR